MATQLICLRHAEAEPPIWDSSRGAVGGGAPPDPPLTERGRRQAEAVAHRLLGKRPQKVFVRFLAFGLLAGRLIAVAYTERGEDVIRLISARKANKHETKQYYDQIAN
jgi:hypothetical protein